MAGENGPALEETENMEQKMDDRLELPDEMEYPPELTAEWELLERLSGRHEMETLLARRRTTGEKAVVKCFPAGHPQYGQTLPASLRTLKAPPLPGFLAEYVNARMRCVLWEYVEGETLAAAAAERSFSPEETRRIGIALCRQLQVIHGAVPPIIHRDVKPQNIILKEDGTPVLIDFGIARADAEEKRTDTLVLGTQGFAPPEQYGFSQTDARSDLYALGMVLHWLRTGRTEPPAEGTEPLDRVIRRMTAFDPDRRYADAQKARKALEQARPGAGRPRLLLGIAAVAVALAGLVFGLFSIAGPNRVTFTEPLVEQAVRLNLGMAEGTPVTREDLARVKGIYIVADGAYGDENGFYPAIGRWYAEGRPSLGQIETLADLAGMPNLEQVCVAAEQLSDISGLAGLKHLNKVEFKHNTITDISVLADMLQLSSVGLNGNPVTDLTPLLRCPALAFLDLCDVRNYDPKIIGQLGNFSYLDIANPTESYRYLGEKSIQSLSIAWSGLKDLNDLKGLTRLEDLEIGHTAVSDLTPLTVHTSLKRLRLAGTGVRDLTPLLSLPKLERITLSRDMAPLLDALGEAPFAVEWE